MAPTGPDWPPQMVVSTDSVANIRLYLDLIDEGPLGLYNELSHLVEK
jgi:hypothetical protein